MAALLAAGIVVLHLAYLLYAAFGGFLALRRPAWVWPHIASTIWSVVVTTTSVSCPLTAAEKWLLQRHGETPYTGSFTAHYLRDVVYPAELEVPLWLGMIALALTSYVLVLMRRVAVDRRPRERAAQVTS